MPKIIVTENVSLDGVMQAPGRPDEDTRDGFTRGGWAVPHNDPVLGRKMGEGMASTGALLLGRRTWADFAGYWPRQTGNPFTPVLDALPKHVASTTLDEPLPWVNSHLLKGDVIEAVRELKARPGPDIAVLAAVSWSGRCAGTGWSTRTCCWSTRWCSAAGGGCSTRATSRASCG